MHSAHRGCSRRFRRISEAGCGCPTRPVEKRMAVLLRQARLTAELKGERIALREIRKHAAWYMRGLRGAAGFRAKAGEVETLADLAVLCVQATEANTPD